MMQHMHLCTKCERESVNVFIQEGEQHESFILGNVLGLSQKNLFREVSVLKILKIFFYQGVGSYRKSLFKKQLILFKFFNPEKVFCFTFLMFHAFKWNL